jgi:hypothetical protein
VEERIPKETYVVGDEIRLAVKLVYPANVETAQAIFRHEEHEVVRITLEGDVVLAESESPAQTPYRPSYKAFWTDLVTLVDVDHPAGIYRLETLRFVTASGERIVAVARDWEPPVRFRIHREPTQGFHMEGSRVTAYLTDVPTEE